MSDTLVDRIEGAKASCEAAFEVVNDKYRELEDHYPGVGGQLKDFKAQLEQIGELSTTTEDSDSDGSIDDPAKYFWKCEFCPAELDQGRPQRPRGC